VVVFVLRSSSRFLRSFSLSAFLFPPPEPEPEPEEEETKKEIFLSSSETPLFLLSAIFVRLARDGGGDESVAALGKNERNAPLLLPAAAFISWVSSLLFLFLLRKIFVEHVIRFL
jgi:hypothetical protein